MNKKNIVYWLLCKQYDLVESGMWSNECVSSIGPNADYYKCALDISEKIKQQKPIHYAVVSDIDNADVKAMLTKHFISNNVIDISASYDKVNVGKQIEWILSDFGCNKNENSNVWFISDCHFNHRNIIQYCNRPWNSGKGADGNLIITVSDVKQMTEDIIANWNSVVGKNDIVWNLGDFVLGPNQKTTIPEIVSRLNGKINLVLGNHDHQTVKFYYEAGIHRVYDKKVIINDYVVLSHTPMEFVKAPFFNCFGHVHDCTTYNTWSKDSCCVCVERHNYTPVSWGDIQKHYDELNQEQ